MESKLVYAAVRRRDGRPIRAGMRDGARWCPCGYVFQCPSCPLKLDSSGYQTVGRFRAAVVGHLRLKHGVK